jgi:hypothetical protein
VRNKLLSILALTAAVALGGDNRPAWHPVVDSGARLTQLFDQPPAEYSTSPFFVWNGEVTEADIDFYMDSYHAQGIRSIFIHPRPGLITEYLSDRWFQLVRYTVDKGAKLGMEVWLYDENSYPSGFAGGHVPAEMPESYNEGQGLLLRRLTELARGDDRKYKVVLRKDPDGFRDITFQVKSEIGKPGTYYAFELAYYDKRAWHGGYSYVDLLKPGVTRKFIEVTMRGYQKSIGNELGHRVPGIFTDEPNIVPPRGKDCMRWTPDLFAQFSQRWGYDLRPHLASLYEETGDYKKVRHNFYALLLELFIDRWSKPWSEYATTNGIFWTGHYWEHGWPSPNDGPDNMAMYAWHQVPAIDMLFNQFREDVNAQFGNARAVKELSSVANQMGRRRTLSETYGGAGWELRFEDMKRLGEWQYVLGVNLMNQHLSFGTMVGARKHDYPQSFSYHTPWWPLYRTQADYFARLSLALSIGEQKNRILVIEPTTSAWMYPSYSERSARMKHVGDAFQDFVNRLEAAQVEYDLGSENIMKAQGTSTGGKLTVGRRAYDLVILPPGTENLDSSTAKLIETYVSGGGALLSFVDAPARVDGAASDRISKFASSHAERWIRANSLDDAAVPQRLAARDFRLEWNPASGGKLFHHRRQLDDGQLIYLVNSSLEQKAVGTLRAQGASLKRLDPATGVATPYPAKASGADLDVAFDLAPAGSLLLVASNTGTAVAAKPAPPAATPVRAASPVEVKRLTPNTLTIDYCDLKLAGAVTQDMYYYAAAKKVFQHYGFEANPWDAAVQYKTNILDRNNFPADSGFEATYYFHVAGAINRTALRAVVERPRLWKVSVNGKPVDARPGEWWLDRDFGVYDIGPLLVEGRNAITIAASPMSVHNEIEPLYLTGDFGVEAQASGWRLTPSTPLKTGAWKEQHLPFYSHTVSYGATYKFAKVPARALVRLGKWNGTVAEVRVNGKSAGTIGWQPYELDVTKLVRAGANRVEVVVYGSLKNLLGPHHGKINRGLTGPGSFRNAPETTPGGASYDLDAYGLMENFEVAAQTPIR